MHLEMTSSGQSQNFYYRIQSHTCIKPAEKAPYKLISISLYGARQQCAKSRLKDNCELSFNRDFAHCWRAFYMSNKYYLLTYMLCHNLLVTVWYNIRHAGLSAATSTSFRATQVECTIWLGSTIYHYCCSSIGATWNASCAATTSTNDRL